MSWKLREKAKRLLAEEKGTVYKGFGGKVTIALAYPNTYHVGMSNLGFLSIYHYLNLHPKILCERVFLPDSEDLQEYERTRATLSSFESGEPLSSFDILAFSVSYENDYLHILNILDLARIPPLSEQRDDKSPLLIMGGVCAFSNPEPVADFFDLIFLGEGEDLFPEMVHLYGIGKEMGRGREELLREAMKIEGVYVPRYYQFSYGADGSLEGLKANPIAPPQVRRHYVFDLDRYPISNFIETSHTELGGMRLLEVNRGCKGGCLFCLTSGVYRPFRFRKLEGLLQSSEEGFPPGKRIGLVGACLNDHPQIGALSEELMGRGLILSTASLRAGSIPDALLSCLARSGQKTVALAPEASSERLRYLIGKEISNETFFAAIDKILALGIPNIKLYFMVGLPSERDEEVDEIAQMAKHVKHLMLVRSKNTRRLGQVTLSINSFVPKPWTPFQWLAFQEVDVLQQKLSKIKRALRGIGNVNCLHDLPQWGYTQALLSRGDRRLSGLLLLVLRFKGKWKKAFQEWSLNPDFYVYRHRRPEEIFPWDHLEVGISKEYLWETYRRTGLS